MQEKNLKLKKEKIGALPIIEVILNRMGLRAILKAYIPHDRYLDSVELLIKNVLCDHTAIYRIKEWAGSFDQSLIYGGSLNDDVIGRALDKLFAIDRSTFQTKLVLNVIKEFNIKTEVLHAAIPMHCPWHQGIHDLDFRTCGATRRSCSWWRPTLPSWLR